MLQRLTSRSLASSRWLTPFDRSTRDVLPLLLGQARPSARETALGPRLRLAGDRAVPDRVPPPLAEGEHHRELELAGGRGRVEVLRQGPEFHSRAVQTPRSPAARVSAVSGGEKVGGVFVARPAQVGYVSRLCGRATCLDPQ